MSRVSELLRKTCFFPRVATAGGRTPFFGSGAGSRPAADSPEGEPHVVCFGFDGVLPVAPGGVVSVDGLGKLRGDLHAALMGRVAARGVPTAFRARNKLGLMEEDETRLLPVIFSLHWLALPGLKPFPLRDGGDWHVGARLNPLGGQATYDGVLDCRLPGRARLVPATEVGPGKACPASGPGIFPRPFLVTVWQGKDALAWDVYAHDALPNRDPLLATVPVPDPFQKGNWLKCLNMLETVGDVLCTVLTVRAPGGGFSLEPASVSVRFGTRVRDGKLVLASHLTLRELTLVADGNLSPARLVTEQVPGPNAFGQTPPVDSETFARTVCDRYARVLSVL